MKIRGFVMCLVVGLALVAPAAHDLSVSVSATGTEAGTAIAVTTTADELINDGNCSLREAIQAVNTHTAVDACGDGGFETIELPSGVYTLTLTGPDEDDNAIGDLDIKGNVTIQGTGASVPVLDGNQLDRVLQVHSGATVTVTVVMIRNGRAPDGTSNAYSGGDGEDGGGIANAGTLTLIGCNISDNRAGNGGDGTGLGVDGGDGGDGGGIANTGTLTLTDCDIGGNRAGDGGGGNWELTNGGDGGRGGGVFNTGTLTWERSTGRDNVSGAGGGSGVWGARSAYGGHGGGIYNAGRLAVKDSTIRGNSTAIGGWWTSPPAITCGSGGYGGGIYNVGNLTLDGSTIHGNRTANGESCGGSHALAGDGGHGGGIYNANTLGLSNSTVSGNITGDGGGSWVGPGDGGDGGGIYNASMLMVDNSTISGNITGHGGNLPNEGAGGDGGGIYNTSSLAANNGIVAGNWAGAVSGRSVDHAGAKGGIAVTVTIQARNTILAGNLAAHAGPDCIGILTLAGYNLIQVISGCTIAGDTTGNIVGVDPLLLPLADNGGPTWTHALAPGSLAVDAGSCTSMGGVAIAVDQRGIGRPQGVTCDVGAYEAPVFPKVYLPVALR